MIINTFATTMTNKVKFRSKDPRGSRGRDREKCREREATKSPEESQRYADDVS